MKPITSEWLKKAEKDFKSASLELRAQDHDPNFDLVCFLSQQATEKHLKAFLAENNIPFPKTHDLLILLDLALEIEPLWEAWRRSFRTIREYSIEFRYPGDEALHADASYAVDVSAAFRSAVLQILPQ